MMDEVITEGDKDNMQGSKVLFDTLIEAEKETVANFHCSEVRRGYGTLIGQMLQGLYDNNNDATKLELCPTIPISKEKIEEWCDPWKNAHIVDVLGRKLVLIMIEHKLHKERAKM